LNNKELYRQICTQYADVPVFLQPWWLDAVNPAWQAVITQKGDHITGIWPYIIDQKLGVKLLRTPLLTPYLGPHVFFPADMKESNRDSFEHDTITALINQLPNVPVWALSMFPGLKQVGLFKNYGLDAQVKQTFLVDLSTSEDTIFSNLKESIRRNIKAAAKEITIVNDAAYLPQLYQYQKSTLNRKQAAQPHTMQHMQRFMDACIAHNSGALWVARKGDEVTAIIWNVWDARTSYYFMGAQNPASHNAAAMSALLWHCIAQAKLRQNQVFDLEGSMDPGVEKFFRGFGGKRDLYLILKKNTSLTWKLLQAFRR
jgi:hypothetical protein